MMILAVFILSIIVTPYAAQQCIENKCLMMDAFPQRALRLSQLEVNNSESGVAPKWESCMSTPTNSYANVTFSPYPLRRGENVTFQTNIYLEDDILPGTYFLMDSWKRGSIIRGPRRTIDLCDFIAGHFPNATQVRCPINQWAIRLVMFAINQFSGSEIIEPLQISPRTPRGNYQVRIRLISGDRTLTCAVTTAQIE